ncbi:MAG: IS982 family transposase, partial [Tannerella sp.]|nr:IS982 family transposase [Tannerella sp.]
FRANVGGREPFKNKRFHEKIFGELLAGRGYIFQNLFVHIILMPENPSLNLDIIDYDKLHLIA